MLDDPLEVFGLQVGNAHMTNNTLLAQFHESWQRLINHLLHVGKLHVVDVDKVDIVNVQPFHALIHALLGTLSRIVPEVNAVLAVTSHLCRENIFVTINLLQSLT